MDKKKFLEENIKTISSFRSTLSNETDRGSSLMAASFLEHELERLLRSKLVGSKKQLDILFEFNGPMGTFSSKIKMCFSLGLLDNQISSDLDLIRRIRNEFGHQHKPIDFDSEIIMNRVKNLKQHFYEPSDEPSNRKIFNNSVLGVLSAIHNSIAISEKFVEKEPETQKEFEERKIFAKKMTKMLLGGINKSKE